MQFRFRVEDKVGVRVRVRVRVKSRIRSVRVWKRGVLVARVIPF